jgi:3-hydroxyisobutyrate dehydrogenase
MAKIGYIGVGAMGEAMILRMIAAGHAVTAYNRTLERTRRVQAAGAVIAASPRLAAQDAESVFCSVTDDEASRAVWTGVDGILSADFSRSPFLVESSTLSHDWVLELASIAAARRLRFLDCPISARPDAVEAGDIRLFVGAARADLAAIQPLLASFAEQIRIFHFGPPGSGTAFKLIHNLMGAIQVAAIGEAMLQAEAAGIDLRVAAEAFAAGYSGSRHIKLHSAAMAEGRKRQDVAFSGRGRLKDAQYGMRLAEKLGRQAHVGKAAAAVWNQMINAGMGEANDSELIDALRATAGTGRDCRQTSRPRAAN